MKLSALLTIAQSAILLNSQHAFSNAESEFKQLMYDQVEGLISEMDPVIYKSVVDHHIIHAGEDTTYTMKALWGYYLSGLVPYTGCREQYFGVYGEYTNIICDSNEIAAEICREEPGCNGELWRNMPVYAVKGDLFKDVVLTSKVLCGTVEAMPYTPANCPYKYYSQFYDAALEIKHIVEHLPRTFDNELLTLGLIDPTEYSTFGTNRILGYGDSFLDIRRDIYRDLFDVSIKLQTFEALAIFVRDQYDKLGAPGKEFVFTRRQKFQVDLLEGYLLQKYSEDMFTDDELRDSIPAVHDLVDVDCSVFLGAYFAWNCTSLEDFFEISDAFAERTYFSDDGACSTLLAIDDIALKIKTGRNTLKYRMGTRCTNSCEDSKESFKVEGVNVVGNKDCDWAVRVNNPGAGAGKTPARCFKYPILKEMCPDTCKTCCKDVHSASRDTKAWFYVGDAPKPGYKTCGWAARSKTKWKCKMPGVKERCPQACDTCIP